MGIKVKATKAGYYGGKLRPEDSEFLVSDVEGLSAKGEKITIKAKDQIGSWMEVLEEPTEKPKRGPKPKKSKQVETPDE